MANFYIDVGTQPLANSVDRLSSSMSQVDASISEMTDQLVQAEKMAAEHVSSNVTYGFFMLTRNQFSQKAIAIEKEIATTLVKIQTYSKSLADIKGRMEKDYNNISQQYLKIFRNIDSALRKSVNDLDKGLVDVAVVARGKMNERRIDSSMKAVAYPQCLLPLAQSMPLAKLKKECRRLIKAMTDFIGSQRELTGKLNASISHEKVEEGDETVYFPVVLFESESTVAPSSFMTEVRMPAFPSTLASLDGTVASKTIDMKGKDELWRKSDEASRRLILDKLTSLCEGLDQRKASIVLNLASKSEWMELRD